MTTARKTAKEISDSIVAQMEISFSQSIPLLPKSFTRVLAKACGLLFVVLFQFASFIFKQMFPTLASNEPMTVDGNIIRPLSLWGEIKGLKQLEGQRWQGDVNITVLTTGGKLLSGSQLVRAETEQLYITIGDVSLVAGTVSVVVRAVEFSESSNLVIGNTLEFISPPSNVQKTATVDSVSKIGANPESTVSWRNRILQFFAARPQGGAYADYWEWSTAVDGVAAAFPYSDPVNPGRIIVFIRSTVGDGTAGLVLCQAVYDNIQLDLAGLASRRPINDYLVPVTGSPDDSIRSIVVASVDIVVAGLSPNDIEIKDDIEEALDAYLDSRENYIEGLSRLPRKDVVTASTLAGIASQVAEANGARFSSLSFSVGGVPESIYDLPIGGQLRMNIVSWT